MWQRLEAGGTLWSVILLECFRWQSHSQSLLTGVAAVLFSTLLVFSHTKFSVPGKQQEFSFKVFFSLSLSFYLFISLPMYNGMIPIAPAAPRSTSKPSDIHRNKRIRAKRSCDLCRKKKTRCDSEVHQPCTKCRLAKTECQFLVEQKKRGPSSG